MPLRISDVIAIGLTMQAETETAQAQVDSLGSLQPCCFKGRFFTGNNGEAVYRNKHFLLVQHSAAVVP